MSEQELRKLENEAMRLSRNEENKMVGSEEVKTASPMRQERPPVPVSTQQPMRNGNQDILHANTLVQPQAAPQLR